jgi:uncharacterized protein (TIGR02145 family)
MKKWLISICTLLFCSINALAQWDDYINYESGSFTDDRDGQEYDWVKIGKQIWMADNLNIGRIIYVIDGKITDCSIEKLCYDNKEENCRIYGGLYSNQVIDFYTPDEGGQGICPDGWHIPAESEWQVLVDYLGGPEVAGSAMKEAGITHWKKPNKGATNSSGFTALPGGNGGYDYGDNIYSNLGKGCCFWSSTGSFSLIAALTNDFRTVCLLKNKTGIARDSSFGKSAHSVRCVKN